MKSLYLAIQQHESRRWSPVAKVTKNGGVYRLVYTKGAWEVPGFSGFARMEDLYQEYRSAEIFPILKIGLCLGRGLSIKIIFYGLVSHQKSMTNLTSWRDLAVFVLQTKSS